MRKLLIITLANIFNVGIVSADIVVKTDSLLNIELSEIAVTASSKENTALNRRPIASTTISLSEVNKSEVTTIKNISANAPNFFIPDYGSSLTSAIYIRGVGSRINTPAVGLYVDDIPYIDKSAFSFNFMGVDKVDVLRGPQATLYGRNTMGGLVHIQTVNPFKGKETIIRLSGVSRCDELSINFSHHGAITERLAVSAEGFYNQAKGFFHNDFMDINSDEYKTYGVRTRCVFFAKSNLKFDLAVSYENTDEAGYAYKYWGVVDGEETFPELKNKITSNRRSGYKRSLFNSGLKVLSQLDNVVFTSVTSFQGLSDHMLLDQDFLATDTFELDQYQHQHTLTEEVVLKNRNPLARWQWTNGLFGYYQWLKIESPVCFNKGGIQMIQSSMDAAMLAVEAPVSVKLTDDNLYIPGDFATPSYGVAFYHQSSFDLTTMMTITAGIRADYECIDIDYNTGARVNCNVIQDGYSSDSYMKINYASTHKIDYLKILPKFSLSLKFDDLNMLYATISNGHRSGGYNVQMFADVVSTSFQTGENMSDEYVNSIISYEPESCWNYEVGAHIQKSKWIKADFSIFYMDIRNQQIARFAEGGLGRRVVNAGQSNSYGIEVSVNTNCMDNRLLTNVNYGYTYSSFNDYTTVVEGQEENYAGNIVPFVPRQTLSASVDVIAIRKQESYLKSVSFGTNVTYTGKIYWDEANTSNQNGYVQLGAHANVIFSSFMINVWGKNLTDSNFNTFYFESMNHRFKQQGKPLHFGLDLIVRF